MAAPNESELKEIKKIVREQHETVNAIANVLKQGAKQTEEVVTEQNELSNSVRELSKAVNFLLLKDEKQQYTTKTNELSESSHKFPTSAKYWK